MAAAITDEDDEVTVRSAGGRPDDLAQVGVLHFRSTQVRATKIGRIERGSGEGGVTHVRAAGVDGSAKVGQGRNRLDEVGLPERTMVKLRAIVPLATSQFPSAPHGTRRSIAALPVT